MSEFDKEAERERLREKFAQDEAERASARHMSELLLQGLTMTDRHCPECGAPLFRDDERTFCPECERDVAEGSHEAAGPPDVTAPEPPDAGERGAQPRANLVAALNRSAAAAATTDDPRVVREHLEAAQAAIEAIRALDQSGS